MSAPSPAQIERAARAIAAVWGHHTEQAWLNLSPELKSLFRDAGRAALEAAALAENVVELPHAGRVG